MVAEYIYSRLILSQTPESFRHLFVGGVSKFLSTVITFPLQVIKTRMQVKHQWVSLTSISKEIWEEGRIYRFLKGLEEKLVQTVLTAATTFFLAHFLTKFKVFKQIPRFAH